MARRKYIWQFVIDGDSEKGVKALRQQRAAVDELESSEKKSIRTRADHRKATDDLWKSVARLAGPIGIGLLTVKLTETIRETELLKGQLVTMTGSTDRAALAFDKLNSFAAQTPFTLDQSVQGFIKLTALGLTPSERALRSYGNTAAAMGKDLNQMIEAVADASTMEFERLKEFGIKARQQTDTVTFTFQGAETTVEKSAGAIEEYLQGIGENQFGDAMANQMDTVVGKISNLQDAWDNLFRMIGEQGATSAFGNLIELATNAVVALTEIVRTSTAALVTLLSEFDKEWIRLQRDIQEDMISIGKSWDDAVDGMSTTMEVGAEVISSVWTSTMNGLKSAYAAWIEFVAAGMEKLPGMDGFAADMRRTADGLRASVAETGNLEQRIGEILDKFDKRQLQRNQQAAQQREALNRDAAEQIRIAELAAELAVRDITLTEEQIAALEGLANVKGKDQDATEGQTSAATELIADLEEELRLLGLSEQERQFAILTRELSAEAIAAEGDQIRQLIAEIEREKEAQKAASDAAKEAARIRKNQLENLQKGIEGLLDDFFEKKKVDVGDFFDFVVKSWFESVKKMAAANITAALFNQGGGNGFNPLSFAGAGGGQGGGFNPLNLGGTLSTMAGNIGGFAQGLFGFGQGSATFMGPMTQSATMGANFGAFMTSPAGLAIAAAVVGKIIHDKTSDPDGFKNSMAGMLVGNTPGANRAGMFAVDPFLSGFAPQGFADRRSVQDATKVIDTFRGLDATIVELVRALGGDLNLANATLAGVGVEGRAGTAGTFLGMGGRTQNFGAQLDLFARQLARHVSGLSADVMDELAAARTAEQIIQVLTEAADSADELGEAAEQARQAERALAEMRRAINTELIASMQALGSSFEDLQTLRTRIENDLLNAQGISLVGRDASLPGVLSGSYSDQISAIEAARAALIAQYNEQLAFERQLHAERVRNYEQQLAIAGRLDSTINGILGGQHSPLSNQEKMALFGSQFENLAGLAEGGDLDAAGQVGPAAQAFVEAIRGRFASSAQGDAMVNAVLERLAGIQAMFAGAEDPGDFSSGGLTRQLTEDLEALQDRVTDVHDAIANDAVNQLIQLNAGVIALPEQLTTAMNLPETLAAVAQELVAGGVPVTALADQIAQSIVLTGAANEWLANNGGGTVDDFTSSHNPLATPELIQQFANQVIAEHGGVNDESARAFIATAIEHGVGSKQVADALGLDQVDVINLAKRLGFPEFAAGGIVSAPTIGLIGEGGQREAVLPLPPDFNLNAFGGDGAIAQELRRLNSRLQDVDARIKELNAITISAAHHASEQRIESNEKLDRLGGGVSGGGVGSARYARSA